MTFTCKELVRLVTDYLEDRLPPEERARFQAHLNECYGCRYYLEQMRQTVRLTGMLREEHVSREAERTLLAAFADWKKSR